MKKIKSKSEGACVATTFLSLKSYGDFLDPQGQLTPQSVIFIWLKFELSRDVILVLVTCKNEEDPIKNKGARVATRLYVDFSDTQGQVIR